MPSYYNFKIKGVDCDVNDILQAVDNKLKENHIECSRMEFNYFSNAIEYLMRANFKGQKESDLRKAISEIFLILNDKENDSKQ